MNGIDEFIGELLRGNVSHARSFFMAHHVLPDGMQQMGFAKAYASIEKERVVGLAWRLGHGQGCSMRKCVVVADNEGVECVLGVKRKFARG